uniref:Uncharacterized protein n=1 Tax=Rhizophora mucronata TaxID=61149 RepID=A0A2P2PAH6_RHIMU
MPLNTFFKSTSGRGLLCAKLQISSSQSHSSSTKPSDSNGNWKE